MKKNILFITMVLAVMFIFSTSVRTQSKPTIGVTIYRYDDYFMSFVRRYLEIGLKGKATVIINDSKNDQAKQNEQVDTMISRRASVLAINLVDPKEASTIISKAKAKDIPVIFFNKEPSEADMKSYDKTWYVGTSSEESGIMQGNVVVESWRANANWDKNKDKKLQYVLLKGDQGHPDAAARTKYVINTITANKINVQKLEEESAMWDTAKAKEMVETWITKHGDKIEFIICNNDGMAIGALQAVQAHGYNKGDAKKFIPIVGVDAIPDCLIEIRKGTIVGTILNDPKNQSKAVIDLSLNASAGNNPIEGTSWKLDAYKAVRVPYVPITLKNITVGEAAYK